MAGLGALLIFMMFNSRKKQKAQQEKLSSGLVPGAKVMTSFGVFGTVLDIDLENNRVTIESGPGTVLTVHRQAIGNVEAAEEAQAPSAEEPAGDREVELPADTRVPDDLSSLDVPSEEKAEERGADESGPDAAEKTDGESAEGGAAESASTDREDGERDSGAEGSTRS